VGEFVDIGCLDFSGSICADIAIAKVVKVDNDDIGRDVTILVITRV
jgi:hypothetical protein